MLIRPARFHAGRVGLLLLSLAACATQDESALVDGRHVRDVASVPMHVALRSVRIADPPASVAGAADTVLLRPEAGVVSAWTTELAERLRALNMSAVAVDANDDPLVDSPYDLGVEVSLLWAGDLQSSSHNFLGSFLAWGFLWPLSVTEVAAVEDRSYQARIGLHIRLRWLDAEREVQVEELGPLRLSFPQRQDGFWWKVAAFTPVYFVAPDAVAHRDRNLYRSILDRVALHVARVVKLDPRHASGMHRWVGDYVEFVLPAGMAVQVAGGMRERGTDPVRFLVPRETTTVRATFEREASGVRERWTQTLTRRP